MGVRKASRLSLVSAMSIKKASARAARIASRMAVFAMRQPAHRRLQLRRRRKSLDGQYPRLRLRRGESPHLRCGDGWDLHVGERRALPLRRPGADGWASSKPTRWKIMFTTRRGISCRCMTGAPTCCAPNFTRRKAATSPRWTAARYSAPSYLYWNHADWLGTERVRTNFNMG